VSFAQLGGRGGNGRPEPFPAMPREIVVYKGLRFLEDIPFWLMDQPAGPNDVVVGSGDLSSTYDFKVYDITSGGRPTLVHSETTGNLTLKASQTTGGVAPDPLWTLGGAGYTAALKVDPANWDTPNEAGNSYRLILLYASTTWGSLPLIYEGLCVQQGAAGTLT